MGSKVAFVDRAPDLSSMDFVLDDLVGWLVSSIQQTEASAPQAPAPRAPGPRHSILKLRNLFTINNKSRASRVKTAPCTEDFPHPSPTHHFLFYFYFQISNSISSRNEDLFIYQRKLYILAYDSKNS